MVLILASVARATEVCTANGVIWERCGCWRVHAALRTVQCARRGSFRRQAVLRHAVRVWRPHRKALI